MGDLLKFLNDRFRALIQALKSIQEGYNTTTGTYGGGGIDEVNNKLEAVKTKLDTLDVSVKLDDPDIAQINSKLGDVKTDVHTIATNSTSQGTELHSIYTMLDERLVKKLWITRADYDQLVLDDEVDPETLYIVIESQSNPSNP